ncbi:MAG: hypothetical protein WAW36_03150 [Methylovulum miyakonense]|uniref:hypothetical protein n=1 Tax=Methylovulum miyakonense TaxID=645578 RepID=UPI003BB7E797
MNNIYIWIAALAVYGDLLKRLIPGALAVAALYVLAISILISIIIRKKSKKCSYRLSKEGKIISMMSVAIIYIYVLQIPLAYNVNMVDSVMVTLYMATPLLYIIVISKYCPDFDLTKLARPLLWMMIPINIVGIIQSFINPEFLVSTSYIETGGIVSRNLISGGAFNKYPSIFASPDRYSGMGLMQFYFTVVLLNNETAPTRYQLLWITFNFISGCIGLAISGARIRILILMLVLMLALLTFVLGVKSAKQMKNFIKLLGAATIVVLIASFAMVLDPQLGDKLFESVPIIGMMIDTFETGDATNRSSEGIEKSMIPDNISLFGEGLGSLSTGGNPPEFALSSIWIESGIFFGIMMLFAFTTILLMLVRLTFLALKRRLVMQVIISSVPFLLILVALLTGFKAAFELSAGILLGCSIAAISCKKVVRLNTLKQ